MKDSGRAAVHAQGWEPLVYGVTSFREFKALPPNNMQPAECSAFICSRAQPRCNNAGAIE